MFWLRFWINFFRFWVDFWSLKSLILVFPLSREHNFYKFDIFGVIANWFKIPGFGACKSIENSRNFENKTSLNTSLFLTLIFFDFLSILTPKLAFNGCGFLRVFFKMGPKGAQEAPRGLQEVILREFGFHCGRFLASFFRSCWIFPEYFWASGLAFVPVHVLSCFP